MGSPLLFYDVIPRPRQKPSVREHGERGALAFPPIPVEPVPLHPLAPIQRPQTV